MSEPIAIIWDLDGVHYNYDNLPDRGFHNLCNDAHAAAAMELIPDLSEAEARQLALDSHQIFQDCYGAFLPLAAKAGLSETALRETMFKKYHIKCFELMQERHPAFFDDAKLVAAEFAKADAKIRHGILSHSCMEGWGTKVLEEIGILRFFQSDALLGLDQYDFVHKFESTEPLQKILKILNATPENAWFVEDSLPNLKRAKDIGINTVFMHYDKPLAELPPYVDFQFSTPADVVRCLSDAPERAVRSHPTQSKPFTIA